MTCTEILQKLLKIQELLLSAPSPLTANSAHRYHSSKSIGMSKILAPRLSQCPRAVLARITGPTTSAQTHCPEKQLQWRQLSPGTDFHSPLGVSSQELKSSSTDQFEEGQSKTVPRQSCLHTCKGCSCFFWQYYTVYTVNWHWNVSSGSLPSTIREFWVPDTLLQEGV